MNASFPPLLVFCAWITPLATLLISIILWHDYQSILDFRICLNCYLILYLLRKLRLRDVSHFASISGWPYGALLQVSYVDFPVSSSQSLICCPWWLHMLWLFSCPPGFSPCCLLASGDCPSSLCLGTPLVTSVATHRPGDLDFCSSAL